MPTTIPASRTSVPRSTLQQGGRPTHLRLVRPGEPGAVRVRHGAVRLSHGPVRVSHGAVVAESSLRLTARGRAVLRALVVLALVGLMTATALLMARRADAADGPTPKVVVRHHVVLPGETLWGIATELAPRTDPRDTIAGIVEFNALQSSAVHAGQDLAIPPQLSDR